VGQDEPTWIFRGSELTAQVIRGIGMLDVLFGLFGLASLLGIAWAFSDNKRKVDWKLVGTGVLLQLGFASVVLLTPWGAKVFDGCQGV